MAAGERNGPALAEAWDGLVAALQDATAMDPKTRALAYLAVLAAAGRTNGIPFHAMLARQAGASRAEVVSAALVGLPAVSVAVIQALPGVTVHEPRQVADYNTL